MKPIQMCDVIDTICEFDCEHCGHNPKEIKRRKELLEKNGLTVDENGIGRLIITKEGVSNGQTDNECDAG